jgi:hypothetical protein
MFSTFLGGIKSQTQSRGSKGILIHNTAWQYNLHDKIQKMLLETWQMINVTK